MTTSSLRSPCSQRHHAVKPRQARRHTAPARAREPAADEPTKPSLFLQFLPYKNGRARAAKLQTTRGTNEHHKVVHNTKPPGPRRRGDQSHPTTTKPQGPASWRQRWRRATRCSRASSTTGSAAAAGARRRSSRGAERAAVRDDRAVLAGILLRLRLRRGRRVRAHPRRRDPARRHQMQHTGTHELSVKKKSDRFALLNLTCPDIGKVSAKFYETEHLVNLATISVTEYLGHFDLIPKYALSNYWHSNSLLSNVWFSIKICQ